MQELMDRAKSLLQSGEVSRVLGWKKGENTFDVEVAFFENVEALDEFVYNGFCGANLTKYMIEASKKEGKTLVFLKPCDSYSYNQLLREHRVDREKAYIIGVGCKGKLSLSQIPFEGVLSVSGADYPDAAEELTVQTLYGTETIPYKKAMLERCHVCKGKEHVVYDELLGESCDTVDADRFAEVAKIEEVIETVPYGEETVNNNTVARGTTTVIEEGSDGQKSTKYLVKYSGGVEVERAQISSEIIVEAKNISEAKKLVKDMRFTFEDLKREYFYHSGINKVVEISEV